MTEPRSTGFMGVVQLNTRSPAYRNWFQGLCTDLRASGNEIVEQALIAFCEKHGLPTPPPRREPIDQKLKLLGKSRS